MPRASKSGESSPTRAGSASSEARGIKIPASVSVRQLAELLGISTVDAIKQLMRNGINSGQDFTGRILSGEDAA